MSDFIIVLTTFENEDYANSMAKIVVEKKLAACVQIIPIHSIYRWRGSIEKTKEYLCIIKTTKYLYEKLKKEIKAYSSYEVPEIIALSITDGDKEYLRWLKYSVTIDQK